MHNARQITQIPHIARARNDIIARAEITTFGMSRNRCRLPQAIATSNFFLAYAETVQ